MGLVYRLAKHRPGSSLKTQRPKSEMCIDLHKCIMCIYPIGSMYAIYGNIYHQYTPNVSIYTIHGSYGYI